MARRTNPTIDDDLIDKLLEGREHNAALLGNGGLIGELKKRLAERMLCAEMDEHLSDEEQQAAGNHRNGYSQKSVGISGTGTDFQQPPRQNMAVPNRARSNLHGKTWQHLWDRHKLPANHGRHRRSWW